MTSCATASEAYGLLRRLFPLCRSITGRGIADSLAIIAEHTGLQIRSVPSGEKVFDWEVPLEWNVRGATLHDQDGRKVLDFADNNLHLVGYSEPVDRWVDREELEAHLHSLEQLPDAIPYVTSYYRRTWGFCLPHRQRLALGPGRYHVKIDTNLAPGHLRYGELVLPGTSSEEILLSSYLCHPSMANNELSGPCVLTRITQWLRSAPRHYTYRIVLIPETIGSITYIHRNLDHLRAHVVAGFNLSCLGDERGYSWLPTRTGGTLADKVMEEVSSRPQFAGIRKYSFLLRGGDERQYCSPGVDLPVVTLCRTKFGEYPEYHTSLDNLDLVTERGLDGGFGYVRTVLETLETNRTYRARLLCEPRLGKYGLYSNTSTRTSYDDLARIVSDLLMYADGKNDLLDISRTIGVPLPRVKEHADLLREKGLLELLR